MTDISQIQKYLNGELDARAMHRLERQAQDDPFLMDALEGYQNAKADQQANLNDLAARLHDRVSKKSGRIIPLRMIGIAASILIVCSVGIWWIYQGRTPVNTPAKSQSAPASDSIAAERSASTRPNAAPVKSTAIPAKPNPATLAAIKPVTSAGQIAANPVADKAVQEPPPVVADMVTTPTLAAAKAAQYAPKDTTPLNEMIVMNYSAAKKKDTGKMASIREVYIKTRPDTAPVTRLQATVPGVEVYPGDNKSSSDVNKLLASGNLGTLGNKLLTTNAVMQGRVIAENNGAPIKGATVKIAGTNQITKTDSKGNFTLRADTSHANLEVATRGYQTRKVNAAAGNADSVKTITMAPDDNADLSETVVTGYTSQTKEAGETYTFAHPQKGWSDYRKYLRTNAVSPDGVTGMVKVAFTVDRSGSISNIKIIKGLSAAANKKALAMVKDGPEWAGNSSKRPETITIRIRFGK